MEIRIDVTCRLEPDEPRQWWATVFVGRAPWTNEWLGSTATYTTQTEMWAEAKRMVRSAVALQEFDHNTYQVHQDVGEA